ncbi:hypothetical protein L7F22_048305 [Adiantum nelumboides]|nr:hypothetical protein [Adiantum nelumboides]
MARTYVAVEIDDDVEPQGWKLLRSFSSPAELIRKLRLRGFWANHSTLHELEQECMHLSRISNAEVNAECQDINFYGIAITLCTRPFRGIADLRNGRLSIAESKRSCDTLCTDLHNEHAVQSPPVIGALEAKTATTEPRQDVKSSKKICYPLVDLSKDLLVYDWHVSAENGETVPITEVPYAELTLSDASTHTSFVLSGVLGKEQEQLCIPIQEWKLNLTADFSLAIFAKTANQVWVQLGKAEELYEQTIRSVQVYIQLFLMVVTESELTKTLLFQHLTTKFK